LPPAGAIDVSTTTASQLQEANVNNKLGGGSSSSNADHELLHQAHGARED
jgi:hypothetical protein